MKVNIRMAVQDDAEKLAVLLSELFAIEDDFKCDYKAQLTGFGMLIAHPENSVVFIAETGPDITGMVTGQRVVSTAAGGYSILLEDMYIVPHMRGCGTGTLLLDAIVSWGTEKGARRIQLLADMRNSGAIGFYRACDFSGSNMTGMYRYL